MLYIGAPDTRSTCLAETSHSRLSKADCTGLDDVHDSVRSQFARLYGRVPWPWIKDVRQIANVAVLGIEIKVYRQAVSVVIIVQEIGP